jgi:hypothetical protein
MGIRVFRHRDYLRGRGFHTVDVPASERGWVYDRNIWDLWCRDNLQGLYDIHLSLRSPQFVTGYFYFSEDAMLFTLRWS